VRSDPAPPDAIQSVVSGFFAEALNPRDLTAFDRFCAPDYRWHGMDGAEVLGLEAFKCEVEMFFDAFPDLTVDVRDIVVGHDRAAVRFRETGTHRGQFGDLAPTGITASWDGVAIYRAENELLVEEWSVSDRLGMLEKLGAISLAAPGHSA
jgi:predicted ester cyclase